MSIRRITISVPEEVAARIKRAAGSTPISTWVTALVEDHLDDAELEKQWEAFYRDVNPTSAAKRRAHAMFKRLTMTKRTKRAA